MGFVFLLCFYWCYPSLINHVIINYCGGNLLNSWVAASIKTWSFAQGLGILGINGQRSGFQLVEKLHILTHGSAWGSRLQVGIWCLSRVTPTRVEMFMSKSRIILSLKRKT